MAELKKCPFCGSVADLHQNQAGMFVVRCVKFGCWVSTMPCDFEETAIIKWNTRATTTEAEIRASVIDEALKALSIFNDREHGNEHFIYGIETAKEIFEQLKECE